LDAPFAIDHFESNESNIERSIMTEGPGATHRKLADPGAKRQASKHYQLMTVYVKLRLPNRESKPRGEPI